MLLVESTYTQHVHPEAGALSSLPLRFDGNTVRHVVAPITSSKWRGCHPILPTRGRGDKDWFYLGGRLA